MKKREGGEKEGFIRGKVLQERYSPGSLPPARSVETRTWVRVEGALQERVLQEMGILVLKALQEGTYWKRGVILEEGLISEGYIGVQVAYKRKVYWTGYDLQENGLLV